MVGDESGLLCSGIVEWCRFVLALEKSKPRECLGRLVAGECDRFGVCMKAVCESSCFGEGGWANVVIAGAVSVTRGGGSWSVNPRERRSGRRIGRGVVGRAWSSLLLNRSRKVGEGCSGAFGPLEGGSENERLLLDDTFPGVEAGRTMGSITPAIASNMVVASASSKRTGRGEHLKLIQLTRGKVALQRQGLEWRSNKEALQYGMAIGVDRSLVQVVLSALAGRRMLYSARGFRRRVPSS
jgi:hypothetical protein